MTDEAPTTDASGRPHAKPSMLRDDYSDWPWNGASGWFPARFPRLGWVILPAACVFVAFMRAGFPFGLPLYEQAALAASGILYLLVGPAWLLVAVLFAALRSRQGVAGRPIEKLQILAVAALLLAHFTLFRWIWPHYAVIIHAAAHHSPSLTQPEAGRPTTG